MAFKPYKGKFKTQWYPKKASTAMTQGALTYLDANGQLDLATASTDEHIGVIDKTIAATDSDYASNTFVPVLVGDSTSEWLADVTGTFASTNVGDYLDLSTSLVVNAAATANNVVYCTKYISASKGLFIINSMAATRNPVGTIS